MNYTYCPNCGEKLTTKLCGDEGMVPYCEKCDKVYFNFSQPCVICLIADENNNIALIKQSYVSEKYICVAGFLKQAETAELAAAREVNEETGLDVLSVKYLNSYFYEKNDLLMLGFVCSVKRSDFLLSEEVESAKWFSVDEAYEKLRTGSIGKVLLNDWIGFIR
ncbi:MAG: NUDIX domain-containing protein [Ruminococcus sp.]|nr:NUDIX domain-containing protein [Ruminococcus sp.]